jgi:hypothetical protein
MNVLLKSRSWHFWIANFGHKRISTYGTDICDYTRAFIKGFFWLTIYAAAALLFGAGTLNGIFEGYMYFMYDIKVSLGTELIAMIWAVIGVLLFTLVSTFATIEYGIPAVKSAYNKIPRSDEPTFIGSVYRKFKDKTCFRIQFHD